MVDQTFDAAGTRRHIDQMVADAQAKAERYQAMSAAVGQVSVSGSSPDGVVTATVDSSGNVADLRITDKVRELSGTQVADAVLAAMRTAQAKLPERLRAVMAETIGDDQNTIDTIVGNYRAKFPEPEAEQQAAQPATRPATDEDDGWAEPIQTDV